VSTDAAPQQVVLVRHARTEWSITGRHTGRTDIPLTEEGREVARRLREPLARWTFTHVFSSPLSRARETCELAGLGDRAQLRDELLEWDYGRYEGITTPQIREERPGWDLWRDGCPEGETAADVGARIDRLLGDIRALRGDVACFAHGHVLRVLGARWLGLPPGDGALLGLGTGAVSALGHEREHSVIWRWNDTSVADTVPRS
jgi:probable phosphoglycerate mutase